MIVNLETASPKLSQKDDKSRSPSPLSKLKGMNLAKSVVMKTYSKKVKKERSFQQRAKRRLRKFCQNCSLIGCRAFCAKSEKKQWNELNWASKELDLMKQKDDRIQFLWNRVRNYVNAYKAAVKMQKLAGKEFTGKVHVVVDKDSYAYQNPFLLGQDYVPFPFMYPDGKIRLQWEFLSFIAFIVILFTDPLTLAFPAGVDVIHFEALFMLECIMATDMFLFLITTFRNNKGKYETNAWKILKSYLFGRFIIDLLPLIGFFKYGIQENELSFLKILRIGRIPHLMSQYEQLTDAVLDSCLTNKRSKKVGKHMFAVFSNLIILSLTLHFVGCSLIYIELHYHKFEVECLTGCQSDFFSYSFPIFEFENEKSIVLHSFFTSIYVTIELISTIGYGDITPITAETEIVFMFYFVCGIFIFPLVMKRMEGSFKATFVTNRQYIDDKMEAIEDIIFAQQRMVRAKKGEIQPMPLPLIEKIKTFCEKYFENSFQQVLADSDYWDSLKQQTKAKASYFLFQPLVDKFYYFFNDQEHGFKADDSFISQVVSNLSYIQTYPGQIIIASQEIPEDIFFISKGQVLLADGNVFKKQFIKLIKGSFFGEVFILLNLNSSFMHFADPTELKTEILSLEGSILLNLLEHDPQAKLFMVQRSMKRLKYFKRMRALQRICMRQSERGELNDKTKNLDLGVYEEHMKVEQIACEDFISDSEILNVDYKECKIQLNVKDNITELENAIQRLYILRNLVVDLTTTLRESIFDQTKIGILSSFNPKISITKSMAHRQVLVKDLHDIRDKIRHETAQLQKDIANTMEKQIQQDIEQAKKNNEKGLGKGIEQIKFIESLYKHRSKEILPEIEQEIKLMEAIEQEVGNNVQKIFQSKKEMFIKAIQKQAEKFRQQEIMDEMLGKNRSAQKPDRASLFVDGFEIMKSQSLQEISPNPFKRSIKKINSQMEEMKITELDEEDVSEKKDENLFIEEMKIQAIKHDEDISSNMLDETARPSLMQLDDTRFQESGLQNQIQVMSNLEQNKPKIFKKGSKASLYASSNNLVKRMEASFQRKKESNTSRPMITNSLENQPYTRPVRTQKIQHANELQRQKKKKQKKRKEKSEPQTSNSSMDKVPFDSGRKFH